jgi:hypothetical protein
MTATTSPTPSASAIPLGRPKSINHSAKCKPRVAPEKAPDKTPTDLDRRQKSFSVEKCDAALAQIS